MNNKKELAMYLYDNIVRLEPKELNKLTGKDVLWWIVEFEEKNN